jgi:hypothetical protein
MFDVFKMTDEELKIANAEIAAELRKREKLEEEKLWKNFVEALYAYCKRFGDIEIHDDCTIYLNYTDFDLESFGEINPKY